MKESPEDHLNIRELLMKRRLGDSPEDYKNLYDELTENNHSKDYLSFWRAPIKQNNEDETPSDYKDTFNEMKKKLNNKASDSDSLVSITPDRITISAMKIDYSRENLEKVLDFINNITEGAAKL